MENSAKLVKLFCTSTAEIYLYLAEDLWLYQVRAKKDSILSALTASVEASCKRPLLPYTKGVEQTTGSHYIYRYRIKADPPDTGNA